MLEMLERRQMLSVTLNGGLLIIDGSAGDDDVRLKERGQRLVVLENQQRHVFEGKVIGRVEIKGFEGDDRIDARGATATRLRMRIDGGEGEDKLLAPPAGADLFGGTGRDVLVGLGHGDIMDGGPGRDVLKAGDGGSTMFGGKGADLLIGNVGHDSIYTGTENAKKADDAADEAHGGDGEDVLVYDDDADTYDGFEDEHFFLIVSNPSAKLVDVTIEGSTAAISVTFGDSAGFFRLGQPTREDNVVRIELLAYRTHGSARAAITTRTKSVDLGDLPDGSYTLKLVGHEGQTILTHAFEV
jgi:hypothetical protein